MAPSKKQTFPDPPRSSWVPVICLILCSLFLRFHFSQALLPYTIHVDSVCGVSNSSCCPRNDINIPCKNLTLALRCVFSRRPSTLVALIVNEGSYVLPHDTTLTVFRRWSGGISITGNCTSEGCVEILCEENAGLTFIESDNVVLETLVFSGCGFPNNSTSRDFSYSTSDPHFLEVKSALYFLLCTNVTLAQVVVQHTDGIGVVMYNTVGENTITYSKFLNNKRNVNIEVSNTFNGGGGLYIEFAFCYPGIPSCFNGTSNIPEKYTSGSNYVISETVFSENLANVSHSSKYTFILPQRSNHLAFGRGGGLSVFFKGNSSDNTIKIDGSNFVNNTALWGGGIFAEHQDWSYNNTLIVNNSHIRENECLYKTSSNQGTGGGGARAGYIFFGGTHTKSNLIWFENCIFSNNSAYFGGGLSFYAAREPTESSATNSLVFVNTMWQDNIARAGSAADLSVWHSVPKGAVVAANFTNCTFTDNSGDYTSEWNTILGIGTLYLDSIPVYFMGENCFERNSHSALAAVSTGIYLTTNSSLMFVNNTGRHGAAVALLGYAFLETSHASELSFIDNTADLKGGAIYQHSIGQHDLINSRNCFIRYSDVGVTPDEWTSNFYFSGNRANDHNESIYATSLLICMWGGSFGNTSANLSSVFCWSDRWDYDSGNCTTEVRSAPANFRSSSHFNFEIIPGQRRPMPLTMLDDRGSDVTSSSVFIAKALSDGVYVDSSSEYISDNHIEVHAKCNDTNRCKGDGILLETIDPRIIQTKLNVTLLSCPPGMVLRGGEKTASCQCGGHFNGIIQCNATGFYTKLQRGNWIGQYTYNNQSKIVASSSPYLNSISEELFIPLPNDTEELDLHLCHKINRKGTLCGKCRKGYGPTLQLDCIKCEEKDMFYMWCFYLLSEYVPLTLFFIIVIALDIRVTSAPANAFIFFAQVVPTVFTLNGGGAIQLQHAGNILSYLYTLPYDIWNLQFFGPLQKMICLSPHLSTLQVISITYLEAVYPLILIGLVTIFFWLYEKGVSPFVCLFRCLHTLLAKIQQKWKIQRSLIHTFASFILLSYSRFIFVSFYLLTTTPLITDDGGTFGPQYGVVYFDGTIEFLSQEHAPYVSVALFFLMTFVAVPPILLLVPSICRNISMIPIRWPVCAKVIPNFNQIDCMCDKCPKLKLFLEAFHGCYRDGTRSDYMNHERTEFDYRWFAGFYFILRVMIFAIYAFTPEWSIQYSFLQLLCIVGILSFLVLRPYKNDFYNKLDASMFCLLVGINTLTMYNYYKTAIGYSPSIFALSLQYILVFLPLIYISLVVVVYLYKRCCNRLINPGNDIDEEREGLVQNEHSRNTPLAESGNFLPYVEETGRIYDTNQYYPTDAHRSSINSDENSLPVTGGGTTNAAATTTACDTAMYTFASEAFNNSRAQAKPSPNSATNDIHTSNEHQRSSGSDDKGLISYGSLQTTHQMGCGGRLKNTRNT